MNRLVHFGGPALPVLLLLGTADVAQARVRPMRMSGEGQLINPTDYVGGGVATHLGRYTKTGSFAFTPTGDPALVQGVGTSVKVAANGDELHSLDMVLLNIQTGEFIGLVIWTGGTGRFADASGVAWMEGVLAPDGSFAFTLAGVIDF
jgi:hypothetical protein